MFITQKQIDSIKSKDPEMLTLQEKFIRTVIEAAEATEARHECQQQEKMAEELNEILKRRSLILSLN